MSNCANVGSIDKKHTPGLNRDDHWLHFNQLMKKKSKRRPIKILEMNPYHPSLVSRVSRVKEHHTSHPDIRQNQ